LVDFTSYLDDLAARVGCRPDLRRLMRHPGVAGAVLMSPFSAHQYRLRGPHAKPAIVMPVLRRLPRTVPLKRIPLHVLSIVVCKALAAVGCRSFRPHLRLAPR